MSSLSHLNALAMVLENSLINENQSPIEIENHRFLIKFFMDESEQIAARKCAQIGGSTANILKAIHLARYRDANVIYTLPSKSVVSDFVNPKVNPLIASNPFIEQMIGRTDSTALKQIGKRFIYFRGSWEPDSAISISAHVLINDEVDRSNPKTLKTFKTRLDAAKMDRPDLGYIWQFSNPSIPGAGVDIAYEDSDKKHWFIKCRHCSYEWYLTWPDNVDFIRKIYICTKCHNELTDEDRRTGRWVNKHSGKTISGYWFSQMMVPWIPATKVIDDSKGDPSIFYNFTLGLPYVSKDQALTRAALMKCISPDENPQIGNAIGVDVGVLKHYVIGNKYGIFKVGETESWDEIENLRNRFNATMVIDANPYPHEPRKLMAKYPGKVFIHYFNEDSKSHEIIRWGEDDKRGVVQSDRTKIIDAVVADIMAEDLIYNCTVTELENYINHCLALYRTTRTNARGMVVPIWETIDGRADHYCLVAGTKIETLKGEKNIENITINDYVLTRRGYKKVKWSGITKERAKVITYKFSNGSKITATPEHLIYTKNRGFIPLYATVYSDIIIRCQSLKKWYFKVLHIAGILSQKIGLNEYILHPILRNASKVKEDFIRKFGYIIMGQFLRDFVYTTKMIIPSIMNYRILSAFQEGIIFPIISRRTIKVLNIGHETTNTSKNNGIIYKHGIKQQKVEPRKRRMKNIFGFIKNLFVLNAVKKILRPVWRAVNFVSGDVSIVGLQENTGEQRVYNLEIEDCPEYYANGILLHNCFATVYFKIALEKAGIMSAIINTAKRPEKLPAPIGDHTGKTYVIDDIEESVRRSIRGIGRDWTRT